MGARRMQNYEINQIFSRIFQLSLLNIFFFLILVCCCDAFSLFRLSGFNFEYLNEEKNNKQA